MGTPLDFDLLHLTAYCPIIPACN